MKTVITVSEGDEQSHFTSKRSMCEAYGWDYRKFRSMSGVPKNVGRYSLEKHEVGLTIPCRRLREFLKKKINVKRTETGEDDCVYELSFRGVTKYKIVVIERGVTIGVRKMEDAEHECIQLDKRTYELLYTKANLISPDGHITYGF